MPKRRKKKVKKLKDDFRISDIIPMIEENMTSREIGRKIGRHRVTVDRWRAMLKKEGLLKVAKRGRKPLGI